MANLGQELDIKFTAALIIFLNDARAIQSGQVTYIQVSVIWYGRKFEFQSIHFQSGFLAALSYSVE